jgi:PmbA protein
MTDNLMDLVQHVVTQAEQAGASGADAVAYDVLDGHVRVRMGEVEQIQRARERKLGLRVMVGQRQAISATGDLRPETVDKLAKDTVEMAKVIAEDPFAGLPDAAQCGAFHAERPDLLDATAETFNLEAGARWAKEAEGAAMSSDDRIDNSEGAEFGFSSAHRAYAASGGVAGSYRSSHFSGYVVPVATENGIMERDYWYSQRRHLKDLESATEIGQIAAARTVRRLGARQVTTCQVPVVFDDRTASSLVGHLAGALSGYALYRGTSFLRDSLGEAIASPLITVVDDGLLSGGMGTRPFDGEGMATSKKVVVAEGKLETYLLDTYSARKLSMSSTANAVRSVADAPSVGAANFHLAAGDADADSLLEGIDEGFYVTELIGQGVNLTTGEYSRGAAGIWIEKGKLTYAVNEVTIAGHLLAMFRDVVAVGDTLDPYRSVSSPALRIRQMTVAGG